ncbi:MAG TPA: DUF2807 domain-containing protein [Rhizomicrobium sp.]|jgi:hypothetical protein|nr:DUF2807 domain-containing protein [Rhizomicrobium sp.]
MVHKLAIVAVIGLTGSAACIGAAAAIGGKDFGGLEDFSLFDGRPRCEAVPGANAAVRDLDWDGSDRMGLAVLSPATYAPGGSDKLHAAGDPQVLAHLRIRDGNIELDCRGWRDRTSGVTLTLPGREFRKFALEGGGDLTINNLNQADVSIDIGGAGKVRANNAKLETIKLAIGGSGDMDLDQITAREARANIGGSGTIRAKGAIDDIRIVIGGSGRADFGAVTAKNADVRIGGHGDVDIAPSEVAKISIGGSGDVTLHSNPKELETHIGGSGQIHRAAS